jgi:hypothetical protein
MNRKLTIFLGLLALVLVAVAAIFTATRYAGPRGAATGDAGGCGGSPVVGDDLVDAPDAGPSELPGEAAMPSQIIYRQLVDGQVCGRMTIEPMDHVAAFDDLCGGNGQPVVVELDEATAKALLAGYQSISHQQCAEGECPPGESVEVLTQSETTLVLPLLPPLREPVEKVLAQATEEAAPAAPTSAVLTLQPETGAVFANGQALPEASPLKVDLICYASSKSVDLQAGAGPTMANQKLLKLFRTPGGTTAKFGSLAELPDDLPQAGDRDMVHHAQAGMGFVVENNVSSGHARVFVKEASTEKVVLEYVLVP